MSETASPLRLGVDPRFRNRERQPGLDPVIQFCSSHNIALTSIPVILLVEILIYAAGLILFLSIERPFLQLRHRLTKQTTIDSRTLAS